MISESLHAAQYFAAPFPHIVSDEGLDPKAADELLNWLEQDAPWNLVEESFYEQYEFSLLNVDLSATASPLICEATFGKLRSLIEEKFGVRLSERIDVTAHKLIPGQRIRIHNDFIPGQETHRLLVQLNRGWADENGGLLMLFGSGDPKDVRAIFRPVNNSCVSFAISQSSHHAVSTIHSGQRFTLVYSFFATE